MSAPTPTKPDLKTKLFFWLILAAFSTFFAEVLSGADMFPFFHGWGLLVVVPLYGLHILVLGHLVFQAPRVRFSSLIFAGMLFGLYEAYLTKVLWAPPWGEVVIAAGIAPVETLVLVFWWHTWFAFLIPLLAAESILTAGREVQASLPGVFGRLFNSRWGWTAVLIFGGVFQSVNSPSVGRSLLSGLSTTAVLAGLVLLFRRLTRGKPYSLRDLLPDRRQFRILLIPSALMYLSLTLILRPEAIPGLTGQLVIWMLYAVTGLLLLLSQRKALKAGGSRSREAFSPPARFWLGLAGVFTLAAAGGELLLAPFAEPLAVFGWLAGIVFGLTAFIKAVQFTFQSPGDRPHVPIQQTPPH